MFVLIPFLATHQCIPLRQLYNIKSSSNILSSGSLTGAQSSEKVLNDWEVKLLINRCKAINLEYSFFGVNSRCLWCCARVVSSEVALLLPCNWGWTFNTKTSLLTFRRKFTRENLITGHTHYLIRKTISLHDWFVFIIRNYY